MGGGQVKRWTRRLALSGLLLGLAGCGDLGDSSVQGPVEEPAAPTFAANVRPILQANCTSCHGGSLQYGELDLSSHAALLAGGSLGPAVVPGQADSSRLVGRLELENPALRMPLGGRLSENQIDTIREWIDAGALDD